MGLHTHSQIESCLIQLVEVRSFAVSQINISDTPGGSFVCLRIRGTNISWYGNIQILLETCGCYTGLGEWVEYFEEKKINPRLFAFLPLLEYILLSVTVRLMENISFRNSQVTVFFFKTLWFDLPSGVLSQDQYLKFWNQLLK